MDRTGAYERSLRLRREAYSAVLAVAAELEQLTTVADWSGWFKKNNARSLTGNWATMNIGGRLIELHIGTMCVMCDMGGSDATTARYLLSYTQRGNALEALLATTRPKEKGCL